MKKPNIKAIWIFVILICAFITGAVSCEDADKLPDDTADTSDDTVQTTETVLDEPAIDELDYTIDGISYTIEHFDNPINGFGQSYSSFDGTNYHLYSDNSYLLKNGYVVLIEPWRVATMESEHWYWHYKYYLCSIDGDRPAHPEYGRRGIYLFLETNDGKYIVNEWDTVVYDSEWNLIETLDTFFSYAYPLDNGRYFAVNDTWSKQNLSDYYTPMLLIIFPPERFALYRYTEKLTESEFAEIRAVDGGFECVYPEDSEKSGEILFYPVDDMVPFDEQYFTLVYDEESEQYYYLDVAGNKLFDMNFDFACEPTNNSAVVRVDKDYYVIQAIAQD